MAKITLHSSLEHRKGAKVVMAHLGETSFDKEGKNEVEVTDEQLADLLESYPDLSIKGEESKEEDSIGGSEDDKNELGKSEDEKNDIGTDEDDDDLKSPLHGLKVGELKTLAEESGFPKEEWEKLSKAELKAYLGSKL